MTTTCFFALNLHIKELLFIGQFGVHIKVGCNILLWSLQEKMYKHIFYKFYIFKNFEGTLTSLTWST